MNPIKFPGVNFTFGESQEEYLPLPVILLHDPEGTAISCWEFSEEEIKTIVRTKKIYLKQMTFKENLQPILPMVELGDDLIIGA